MATWVRSTTVRMTLFTSDSGRPVTNLRRCGTRDVFIRDGQPEVLVNGLCPLRSFKFLDGRWVWRYRQTVGCAGGQVLGLCWPSRADFTLSFISHMCSLSDPRGQDSGTIIPESCPLGSHCLPSGIKKKECWHCKISGNRRGWHWTWWRTEPIWPAGNCWRCGSIQGS